MTSPQRLGPHMTATRTSATKNGHAVWAILDKGGRTLSFVEWYARWRQFVQVPEFGTIYNDGCLKEIVKFLGALNAEAKGVGDGR